MICGVYAHPRGHFCAGRGVDQYRVLCGPARLKAVMAEFRDCMDLPVTCASEEALRLYNEMLLVYIAVRESALPLVRAVLELEPRFVLAHCVLVGIYLQIAR